LIEKIQILFLKEKAVSSLTARLPQNPASVIRATAEQAVGKLTFASRAAFLIEKRGLTWTYLWSNRAEAAPTSEGFDLFLVCLGEFLDLAGRPCHLIRCVPHSLEEEVEPLSPAFIFGEEGLQRSQIQSLLTKRSGGGMKARPLSPERVEVTLWLRLRALIPWECLIGLLTIKGYRHFLS
jgi:hypothetical protein